MAKRQQKPLTKTQQFHKQWKKEVARIKRAIKSLQQRGFTVEYTFPEMPEHISPKKLAELRSETTSVKMLGRSTFVTKEGEIISGRQAETEMRKKAGRKGALTRKRREYEKSKQASREKRFEDRRTVYQTGSVLWRVKRELEKWTTSDPIDVRLLSTHPEFANVVISKQQNANALLQLLETRINTEGLTKVIDDLEANADEINQALQDYNRASKSGDVEDATVRLATLLKGSSLTQEESKIFTEMSESIKGVADIE